MGRSYLGADALRASVNADGPASPASGRELRRRPARPPARAARVPGDHPRLLPAISGTQSRISGHDRPYLPGWRLAVRRAMMAHIGPEGPRECASHGDRNRRGGLMILITDLVRGHGPGVNSGVSRRLRDRLATAIRSPGAASTTASTSDAGTPRFGSGTSGRASGGLPPRACRRPAPSACSRGRPSPELVRRTPVSSSDPRPFRTALTATGGYEPRRAEVQAEAALHATLASQTGLP